MRKAKFAKVLPLMLAATLATAMLAGCEQRERESSDEGEQTSTEEQLFGSESMSAGTYTFGDTFTYEMIQYTLGQECSLVTVVDEDSYTYQNKTYLKIPITAKNVAEEKNTTTFSGVIFYDTAGIEYTYPGSSLSENVALSDGTTAADDVTRIGNMRQGAEIEAMMYLEYSGVGHYYIEFPSGSDTAGFELDLQIKMNNGQAEPVLKAPAEDTASAEPQEVEQTPEEELFSEEAAQ